MKQKLLTWCITAFLIIGGGISSAEDGFIFNSGDSGAITDLSDGNGWENGVVPTEQDDVILQGATTKAIVNNTLPSFKSITISDGAELVIGINAALPPIVLSDTAKLTIASGTTTMTHGFSTTATAEAIPTLTIASGATLQITQATTMKNINLVVDGTLEQTETGHLVLGTANAEETTYFGLTVNNGTFLLAGGSARNGSDLKIACPVEGGTVVVPQQISITGMHLTLKTGYNGLQIGVGNPTSEKFTVLCEKTSFADAGYMGERFNGMDTVKNDKMRSKFSLGGGATLIVGENCVWEPQYNTGDYDAGFKISGLSQLRIENGGVYNQYVNDTTNLGTTLDPDEVGHVCLVVGNGGTMLLGEMPGEKEGIVEIDNGVVKIVFRQGFEGMGTTPFQGAKAIRVPQGSTATLEGASISWRDHERELVCSVPFIGEGNVFVKNATSKKFHFILNSPDNALTGNLSVDDVANTKVIFNNGINWAGTVYARNVEVDHETTGVSTNSFAGLNLNGDWKVAVKIAGAHDHLTIGEKGVSGEGNLVFACDSDTEEPSEVLLGQPIIACADATELAEIKENIAPSAPKGTAVALDESGTSLVLVKETKEYVFDNTKTDLNDPDAWGGTIPTDKNVILDGAQIEVAGTFPSFRSITLRNGAVIDVKGPAESVTAFPKIVLDKQGTFKISSGTVSLAGFSATATETFLPELTIESGSVLRIDGESTLKNVNLTIRGKLEQTEPGHLVLGTANAGEITYFGLTIEDGECVLAGGSDGENQNDLKIACPAQGGRVVVPQDISITGLLLTLGSGKNGLQIGVNNPEDETFTVLCKKTYFIDTGMPPNTRFDAAITRRNGPMKSPFVLGGGATLIIGEGCIWEPNFNVNGGDVGFHITGSAQLRIENGGVYNQYVHDNTNLGITLNPSNEDHVCLVVGDGGTMLLGEMPGNKKGIVQIEDGVVLVVFPKDHDGNGTMPFEGAKAIFVPEGATATLKGTEIEWRSKDKTDLICSTPFIGGGSVRVTYTPLNANEPRKFYFYLSSSENTITGDLVVEDIPDTKVVFGNGANWGGMVHTTHVEIDRTANATSSNAFGGLYLETDWPVVVTEGGTSDFLTLGEKGFFGNGKLLFSEGVDYNAFGALSFGTSATKLTNIPRTNIPGYQIMWNERQDGLYDLLLKYAPFTIIIR